MARSKAKAKKKKVKAGIEVKTDLKEVSTVERDLTITVPGADVARGLDKAYRKLAGQVRINGYRAGKVPRYVLEQYYKEDTEKRVLEELLRDSFAQAVAQHDLKVVADPKVEQVPELIAGIDLTYLAKVEVKPEITLEKKAGFDLKRADFKITDAVIDEHIEMIRDRHVSVVPVEDRKTVQQSDLVESNFSGKIDGEAVRGIGGVSYVIEVGAGRFYPEAEQALVGKEVGESFDVDVVIPDDHRIESARGKTATLSIRPMELKVKTRPDLSDEFAQDVFDGVETVADLRERISTILTAHADTKMRTELKDTIIEALIEANPFEVPPAMVTRYAEQFASEALGRMPRQHAERIWATQRERLVEDARPRALRSVRSSLLLEKLIEEMSIEVNEEEVDEKYLEIAAQSGQPIGTVKRLYKQQGAEADIKHMAKIDKAVSRVAEDSTLTAEAKDMPLVTELGM